MTRWTRTPTLLMALLALGCAAQSASAASPPRALPRVGTVTVSPLPGTLTAMPQTQISFLGAPKGLLGRLTVTGSSSGRHAGTLHAYRSALGASFIPRSPFAPGERVTVSARLRSAQGTRTLRTSFVVARPLGVPLTEFPTVPGTPADVQSFVSRPDLRPPAVRVTQAGATAPGLLFATPSLGPGQYGPMMFDNAGQLVWFKPLPPGNEAEDFTEQTLAGHPVLTWWQGKILTLGYGLGVDVVTDSAYRQLAVVRAGNGLVADGHEFVLHDNGSAWITSYSPVQADLSAAGGPASGLAVEGVIQEIDVRTGLVMWEWHTLGHIGVSESYSKAPTVASTPYDYVHINSLNVDAHGNVLMSARNTWGLYEISRSGGLHWRLGGKRSTFALGPGVAFAYQHNAIVSAPNTITLFDDEAGPAVHPPSRGEIVKLDPATHTATLIAQFVRNPALTTLSQGNLQSLPGGHWLVGWGGLPNFTEFDGAGRQLFDASFPKGENSYRVERLPWSARPTTSPVAVARASAGGETVYASWLGATDVAAWQVLAGASPRALSPGGTVPRSGFETAIPVPATPYVAVRALDPSGQILGTSAAVAVSAG